jgi:hypothetical protein
VKSDFYLESVLIISMNNDNSMEVTVFIIPQKLKERLKKCAIFCINQNFSGYPSRWSFFNWAVHTPIIQSPPERLGLSSTIFIIPANLIPEYNFHTFAEGCLSWVGKGASGGVAGGALFGSEVALDLHPVGVLLLPFLAGGCAVVGGGLSGSK